VFAARVFLFIYFQEINEQPAAIMRALNFGGRILDASRVKLGGLEEHREALLAIDHLVIAACQLFVSSFFLSLSFFAQAARRFTAACLERASCACFAHSSEKGC
jgi:hypothetical protein